MGSWAGDGNCVRWLGSSYLLGVCGLMMGYVALERGNINSPIREYLHNLWKCNLWSVPRPEVTTLTTLTTPLTSITVHGNINLEIYAARHAIEFRKSEGLHCSDS
jgi:hypothetical protein